MSNLIQRDQQRRVLFAKLEQRRRQYKGIINNLLLSIKFRREGVLGLNKLDRKSSVCRIRNRCVLTGRGRGVYRFARISRIKLRELASRGELTGVSKSSW